MFSALMRRPYGFFVLAAVLAALLCLFPVKVDAPEGGQSVRAASEATVSPDGVPAGADLSERTDGQTALHRTLYYAPCGHSVQHRTALPARLSGLTRAALEQEIGSVLPGAAVTGFSGAEVDVSIAMDIPCPLHWVLRGGEDGLLTVLQNRTGEGLEVVRATDVPLTAAPQEEQDELRSGRIFDDVQALEGYLESLSS